MYISEKAQKYFLKLLKKKKEASLRVFVVHPGTDEAECGISYCSQNEVSKDDTIFEFDGFNIYVKSSILRYLKEAQIDLIDDALNAQIIFRAPYVKERINDSNISLFNRIANLLDKKVNPSLLLHKGSVNLLKITKDNYAILKFSGGCNGCSMIEMTLKNNVERILLEKFPILKGVKDVTEHSYGNHSYF